MGSAPIVQRLAHALQVRRLLAALGLASREQQVLDFVSFFASGLIGTTVFYVVYELLTQAFSALPLTTTLAWTASYTLSIVLQHYLHANIVYHNWSELTPVFSDRYNKSLLLTYAAYLLSMAVSALLALVFDLMHVNHRLAFILNIGATGVLNFLTVSKAMKN